jgi:hypothetical protein
MPNLKRRVVSRSAARGLVSEPVILNLLVTVAALLVAIRIKLVTPTVLVDEFVQLVVGCTVILRSPAEQEVDRALHVASAPPQRCHVSLEFVEAHLVQLPELRFVDFFRRAVILWGRCAESAASAEATCTHERGERVCGTRICCAGLSTTEAGQWICSRG